MRRRDKSFVLQGVLALLFSLVLIEGICCLGYASRGDDGKWFGNGDLKTWHWVDKSDDTTQLK